MHFGHLTVPSLMARPTSLDRPLRTRRWHRLWLMAATGHSQRISPLAMVRLYAVHYASSCAFEWRFYAHCRCCRSLTHKWLNQRASRFQRSAVVRMTNLCDGISKRFRRSVLHQPASLFHLCSATFRLPCYPFWLRFLSFISAKALQFAS